jgi:transcriptional regulator with XRE-family HTH domain
VIICGYVIGGTNRKEGYMMQGSLAERLRVLRAQHGLSLTEASEKIGVNRHTLRDLELGKREPYGPTIRKITEAYGVPVARLLAEPVPLDEAPADEGPTTTHFVEEDPLAAGLSTHVVSGGGIQSSAVGGGFIYRLPTEKEWAEFVRELEDLQHDIAAGEKSKGVAWDTVVGTMDSFKRKL